MGFCRTIAVSSLVFALATMAARADEGKAYGKGVTGSEITKISEVLANPDAFVGKTIRVEGLVTDVCLERGCWMSIAGDKELESIRIKVEDGVIVFPPEAKGKRVVAEGVLEKIEQTREQALAQARHHAEEQGRKFDAAAATDLPTVIYQIRGTGAVIRRPLERTEVP